MHPHEKIAKYCALGPNYAQAPLWGRFEDAKCPEGVKAYLGLTDYPTINFITALHGDKLDILLQHRHCLLTIASAMYIFLSLNTDVRAAFAKADYEAALSLLTEHWADTMRELALENLEAYKQSTKKIREGGFYVRN